MREYSVPPNVQLGPNDNLTDAVWKNEKENANRTAFRRWDGSQWSDVSSAQFAAQVRAIAKGLIALGVEAGSRVSIFADTRYEWTLMDYAIMAAGCATVPIYPSSSAEQVEWILGDSGSVAVLCGTADHAATVESVRGNLPDLAHSWNIDEGAMDTLEEAGKDVEDSAVAERSATLTPDSLATLIYTSGTTGRPKGCELTQGNLVYEARSVLTAASDVFEAGNSTLLFLPLAHVFGKVIEVACVEGGIVIGHWGDIPTMAQMLPQFAPHFLLSVPRVFEKIYNTAKGTAAAKGNVGLKVFEFAERTAIEYSKALDTPAGPNAGLRAKHSIATRLVYSKMHEKTGGNVKYAISGGGPLGERLGHFYRGAGINILEGYGLTETAAAITVNLPEQQKIGSVGPPIPGCSVRIADDGEILLKGPVVFNGYWHNEEATAEAIEPDGWFHSGDIGKLDQDGFLAITGRKKEILVTAAGKNVAPAVLEDRINADPIVGISMVVGDGKPFIACLISIDMENWAAWKQNNNKPESASVADLKDDPDLRAQIQTAIDNANKAVSKAESVRKFEILPFELNEENGDLTPTLKLKRNVVMEKYGDLVESLYS